MSWGRHPGNTGACLLAPKREVKSRPTARSSGIRQRKRGPTAFAGLLDQQPQVRHELVGELTIPALHSASTTDVYDWPLLRVELNT
jgi:hypothetical protein